MEVLDILEYPGEYSGFQAETVRFTFKTPTKKFLLEKTTT